ncbi:MAG TPA: hypothetical protein VIG82_01560, partial [Enteractinococcus sp.]
LLIDRNRAVGVTAWTDLHIGDPAQDFIWLASTDSIEFRDAVISAYHRHMAVASDQVDLHIMRRAALAAEFSLAKYLMSGIQASNDEVIAEAQSMLAELTQDIERTGGQDIGQQFWEPSADQEAADDVVFASEDEHVPQPVSATTATGTPTEETEPAEQPDAEGSDEDAVDEAVSNRVAVTDVAASEEAAEQHQAKLIVHSLSEDGELVPEGEARQEAAEDEDTQPISWEMVRENLEKD